MNTEKIFSAVAELREAAGDGPRTRKLLDALFRDVHTLKANASASSFADLAAAAHEFENVLHALRTGGQTEPADNAIPADIWNSLKHEQKQTVQQAIAEGAKLFLVLADFDVADFDQKFQSLKETLSRTGEVISTSPTMDTTGRGKLNFRILYAQTDDGPQNISGVTFREIPLTSSTPPTNEFHISALEQSFGKLAAELARLPADPFCDVFEQAVRAGRSTAAAAGKEVDFEVCGADLQLNDQFRETIAGTLVHLVRNAVDHGIEASDERVRLGKNPRGKVVIDAANREDQIRITVTDDGRGIDPSLIEQIFRPGFSTAAEVSAISGRGVGLDAVKTGIEEAGGSISVSSRIGHGSTFAITLPYRA